MDDLLKRRDTFFGVKSIPPICKAFFGAVAAKLDPGVPHGVGPYGFVGGSTDNGRIMQFVKRGQFEFPKGTDDDEDLTVPRRYAVVLVVSPRVLC